MPAQLALIIVSVGWLLGLEMKILGSKKKTGLRLPNGENLNRNLLYLFSCNIKVVGSMN